MTDTLLGDPERLNKVADMIQSHPEHFLIDWHFSRTKAGAWGNASTYTEMVARADLFQCGTTARIAGWAINLWAAEVDPQEGIDENAARILGISGDVAEDLFYDFTLTDADLAADRLRRMALDAEATT